MIFTQQRLQDSALKGRYNECILEDGKCLAFFQTYIGLYKSLDMVDDPLGNGLLCLMELPEKLQPSWNDETGYITKVQGGCIILNSTAIVLVLPNSLELYTNGLDALHGKQSLSSIAIPASS